MTLLAQDFNRTARDYDGARRKLIPCFDDFYGAAVNFLPFDPEDAPDILDLGAGTGLLSALVLARLPRARLFLLDTAEEMLARARERFASHPAVDFRLADLAGDLPAGPFDAVVSALAIHHLEDPEKRALYSRIFRCLRPGGVFVNAEQVLAPSAACRRRDRESWLAGVAALGATDAELAAVEKRMRHDKLAPLAEQMAWLAEAGFADIDCSYKNGWFAVFGGRRPDGGR